MGDNHFTRWPVVLYGVVLIMNAIAYTVLCWLLIKEEGSGSRLAVRAGSGLEGEAFPGPFYLVAVALAFYQSWLGISLYAVVSIIWFIPDRRIEKILTSQGSVREEP